MDIVYDIILILHFIGLASVVGGFLVQMKSTDPGGGQSRHGAWSTHSVGDGSALGRPA